MKNSEKAILIGLAGVAVAAVSIFYVAKPNMDTVNSVKAENVTLQNRLDELNEKQAKRDWYLSQTDELQGRFDDTMDSFPADLNQEISIMFVQGIKDNYDFKVSSLGLGQPEQFYTLGLNGGDVALTDGVTADTSTETSTDASTEAATTAVTDTASTDGTELSTDATAPSSGYTCYRAAFPITYRGTYEDVKNVVEYVDNYRDRMVVDSINIAYEAESDMYSGSMNLMCYSIQGEDRAPRSVDLDDVETGVDNIFTGGNATGDSSSAKDLNKYDENDGAAIKNSYDFYAMINAADSDVSAKVVGQNGAGKEASVVSNSDNSVSALSFSFYEKDGKNYCDYDLDGTKYTAEVTSAEDIKILLQSSAKKGDDDKSGIRVTIKNDTELPVYVKVSDDDSSSPRIDIASKTGAVKVYK